MILYFGPPYDKYVACWIFNWNVTLQLQLLQVWVIKYQFSNGFPCWWFEFFVTLSNHGNSLLVRFKNFFRFWPKKRKNKTKLSNTRNKLIVLNRIKSSKIFNNSRPADFENGFFFFCKNWTVLQVVKMKMNDFEN